MSPFGPRYPISETSWRRGAAVAFLVLVVVFGWLLERAEDQTDRVDKRVTKVESPCLKYGAKSKQCKRAFDAAVSTITHPQACAIERKAGSLRAIRELADGLGVEFTEPCAGARIAQERQRGKEREAAARERRGDQDRGAGRAPAPVPSGSEGAPASGQPADSGHPAPAKPAGPRSQPPPAPGDNGTGVHGSAQSATPQSVGRPPVEIPPQAKGPVEGTLEAAGKAATEVVQGAGEDVVAPALCTVRGLLRPCAS